MRKWIMAAWLAGMVFLAGPEGAFAEEKSIGTVAGETAREVKDQTAENYKVASEKAADSAKKVEAEARDAFETFRKQAEEAYRKFQEQMAVLRQNLETELRKFNESYNKPKPVATPAP